MGAVFDVGRAGGIRRGLGTGAVRGFAPNVAAPAYVLVLAATSDRADLLPFSVVVALSVTMLVADTMAVATRPVRMSAGLAQVLAMAGLAMARRRRVKDRGGRFEVETRADGGTRSRVVLPLRSQA